MTSQAISSDAEAIEDTSMRTVEYPVPGILLSDTTWVQAIDVDVEQHKSKHAFSSWVVARVPAARKRSVF